MQPLSKNQILRGFNRQEDAARGAVHELYHDALLSFARRLTRNSHDAEDLLHETFAVLYDKSRYFEQIGQLRNYLFETCKNIFINNQKRHMREKKHAESEQQSSYTDEDFDRDIIYSETRSLIFKCIEALPDKLKIVFRLRYFEELPNETVAERLHIAVKTVYNRYSDARKKLKWDLEQIKSFSLYLLNLFL